MSSASSPLQTKSESVKILLDTWEGPQTGQSSRNSTLILSSHLTPDSNSQNLLDPYPTHNTPC
jgi:hypothetical protein